MYVGRECLEKGSMFFIPQHLIPNLLRRKKTNWSSARFTLQGREGGKSAEQEKKKDM